MKIKLYKCNCIHAIFPYGNGLPLCTYAMSKNKPLPCVEKGCEFYKPFIRMGEKNGKTGDIK